MHNLVRNFAAWLEQEITTRGIVKKFGPTFKYNKICYGISAGEDVTVEEFVPWKFDKYINNNGDICSQRENGEICQKAQCFVHYTFARSEQPLMVLDIQGCGYTLFDPEVATKESSSEGEFLFCTGNLSTNAIHSFCLSHTCNHFCTLLGLKKLVELD